MTANASTLIALLPPTFAAQRQAARYVLASNLTAYLYDWILSISEEHAILAKSGLTRSNAIYFVSRITSQSLLIGSALFSMAPINNCQGLKYAVWTMSFISTMSTSLLFLLRVRAVYQNSRTITVLFGSFWLVVLGLFVMNVNILSAYHIPYTQRCYDSANHDYMFIIRTVVTCIYNTLVFLAISYRLAVNAATEGSWRGRTRSFVKGEGLYSLSRSILQGGQLYYLATIAFFFVNLIVMLSPWTTVALRYILVPAYVAFSNVMACRVFRGVALGIIEDPMLTTTKIAAAFRSVAPVPVDESTVVETLDV